MGEFDVVLKRKATGFGFRILQSEDHTKKVTIGDIVEGEQKCFTSIFLHYEGGSAHENGQMCRGDILIAVDGNLVTGLSHGDVIHFMMNAARQGVVRLTLRRETGSTSSRQSQPQLHIQPHYDNASSSTCE